MIKIRYLLFSILWIAIITIPLGNKPPIGNLLFVSTGVLNVIPPDISDDPEMSIMNSNFNAKVFIDSLNIPHIYAKNDESADFAIGYLHARDRMFQMELIVRMMQGRLSEILGSRTVSVDEYWKHYQFETKAIKFHQQIKAEFPIIYERLNAYSEGINTYLKNAKYSEKPIEYHLLDAAPIEWKPYYSMFLINYMSNMLNHSTTDLYFQKLVQNLPSDILNTFYPIQEDNIQTIIPEKNQPNSVSSVDKFERNNLITGNERDILELSLKEILGSNNWVVSGKKSKSNEAILANDMHLLLSLPGPWFEVQVKSDRKHVYGLTLPGAPYIIAGFNSASAWGMTNAHWDLMDYFIPKYNSNEQIQYGEKTLRVYTFNDTILIKNDLPKIVTIKTTEIGPIVKKDSIEYLVVWIGNRNQNIFNTFYDFETMSTYDQFINALNSFDTPPQNFVFADTAGNIGQMTAGKMFIKKNGYQRGVFNSDNPEAISHGFIQRNKLPQIYNPDKGFIASANQRQIYNSKEYYNWSIFAPQYRGKRISESLENLESVSVNDMKSIQADVLDISARILTPVLIDILDQSNNYDQYVRLLGNWDFQMVKDKIEPTIYVEFRLSLFDLVEKMIFSENESLSNLKPPPQVLISYLVNNTELKFADKIVKREELFLMAFQNAISDLQSKFGNDIENWMYGEYHQTSMTHLLRIPQLSYPAFPSNGSRYTVNVMGQKGTHGSSQRSIIHMTTPIEAYFNIAGGQSGRPSSKHFSNQISDWKNVDYHKVQFVDNPNKLNNIVFIKVIGEK